MILKMSETNALNGYSNTNTNQNNTNIGNKRYLLLPEESVKSIAEQNGFNNLNEEAIRLLSSDVSYRIRHLVHNSIQLMRQSKRRKLTTKDINQALETSDCDKVLGFEARDDPIHEIHIKEANVFVTDDNIVDLNEEMDKIFNATDCQLNPFEDDIRLNIVLDFDENRDSNEDLFNCDDSNDEYKHFYQNLVKAILGTNNQSFSMAMRDLSNNRRISKLLPYLINFIMNGIRRLSHDITQLKRFLQTIQCLLRNPSLHLITDPFQSILVQSILECIIGPLNPISDHWTLRDSASLLLANILNEWFNPLDGHLILKQTFNSLANCLLDFSKPFSSHYGVIKAFQSLGYDMIVQHLYPVLNVYFTHLLPAISPNSTTDPQTRTDGHRVFSELLFISEMICLKTRYLIDNDLDIKLNYKDYNQLSDIFGDSLYARLPNSFDKISYKFYSLKYSHRCGPQISLFETIDSQKTGEDLLDAFYAQTHNEMGANLVDDNSFEDNSVVSDNDRETTAMDLLQIKSTISDPTKGIKLTFKKLKREHNQSELNQKKSRTNEKVRPLFEEPVFETISLKQTSISFNYGINRPIIRRIADIPEPSKWYVITTTNPCAYSLKRRKFKLRKNIKNINLYSCDLFNVL